jgi:hypothetical protein
MRRTLVLLGLIVVFLVLVWPFLRFVGLGRLPGDFIIYDGDSTFYIPVTSAILLSLLVTVVIWLLRK